jgi:hypothetical protein
VKNAKKKMYKIWSPIALKTATKQFQAKELGSPNLCWRGALFTKIYSALTVCETLTKEQLKDTFQFAWISKPSQSLFSKKCLTPLIKTWMPFWRPTNRSPRLQDLIPSLSNWLELKFPMIGSKSVTSSPWNLLNVIKRLSPRSGQRGTRKAKWNR